MASMIDDLMGQLGGGQLEQLAGKLGADPSQVQGALGAALPALLEGLTRNASTPDGAQSLHQALASKHDGSLLDAGDLLGGIDLADGEKILGHVFGGRQQDVTTALAQRSGAGSGLLAQLLPMLAPMVMAWLGRKQRAGGLDAGALGGLLGEERGRSGGMPDLGDLLGGALGGGAGGGLGDLLGGALGGQSGGGGSADGGGIGDVLESMTGGQGGAGGGLGDLLDAATKGSSGDAGGGLGDLGDLVDAAGTSTASRSRSGGGLLGMLKKMLGGR